MLIDDFLISLGVALVLWALISGSSRRRLSTDLWPIFLAIFLLSWTGGLWLNPVSAAPLRIYYWIPFTAVGFFVALLIVALGMPHKRRSKHSVGGAAILEGAHSHPHVHEADLAVEVGFLFWLLLGAAALSILAFYLIRPATAL